MHKYPGMSMYLTGLSGRQKDTRSNPSHWHKPKYIEFASLRYQNNPVTEGVDIST